MQKVLDFIEWGWTRPHAEGYGWVRWYGPIERFEDAVEREADGEKLIWYSLNCNIPLTDERAIAFAEILTSSAAKRTEHSYRSLRPCLTSQC
jgi:hypothetical protein